MEGSPCQPLKLPPESECSRGEAQHRSALLTASELAFLTQLYADVGDGTDDEDKRAQWAQDESDDGESEEEGDLSYIAM